MSVVLASLNVGGLGFSGLYELRNSGTKPRLMLNAYELVRLGYIVVGDTYLMTWESWIKLMTIKFLPKALRWRNHRIMVFELQISSDDVQAFGISSHPQVINLIDPCLTNIKWWDIDSRALL